VSRLLCSRCGHAGELEIEMVLSAAEVTHSRYRNALQGRFRDDLRIEIFRQHRRLCVCVCACVLMCLCAFVCLCEFVRHTVASSLSPLIPFLGPLVCVCVCECVWHSVCAAAFTHNVLRDVLLEQALGKNEQHNKIIRHFPSPFACSWLFSSL
jgi:hypothetical protein